MKVLKYAAALAALGVGVVAGLLAVSGAARASMVGATPLDMAQAQRVRRLIPVGKASGDG